MSLALQHRPDPTGPRMPALAPAATPKVVRVRSPLHTATVELLARADEALMAACGARTAGERYVAAHLCALRAAAAVLAQRAGSGGGRRNVWSMLARTAPELTEWAVFFEETGRLRSAVEGGTGQVSTRQADDLVREAQRFTHDVQRSLDIHLAVEP